MDLALTNATEQILHLFGIYVGTVAALLIAGVTATVCFDQSELQLCPGVREDEERELFNLNSGTLGEMGLGDEGDRHVPALRRKFYVILTKYGLERVREAAAGRTSGSEESGVVPCD
jgi:hypothetical protein